MKKKIIIFFINILFLIIIKFTIKVIKIINNKLNKRGKSMKSSILAEQIDREYKMRQMYEKKQNKNRKVEKRIKDWRKENEKMD